MIPLPFALFTMPGGIEWVIVLIIALLLFGRRLPEICRGLGGSVRSFRESMTHGEADQSTPPSPKP